MVHNFVEVFVFDWSKRHRVNFMTFLYWASYIDTFKMLAIQQNEIFDNTV